MWFSILQKTGAQCKEVCRNAAELENTCHTHKNGCESLDKHKWIDLGRGPFPQAQINYCKSANLSLSFSRPRSRPKSNTSAKVDLYARFSAANRRSAARFCENEKPKSKSHKIKNARRFHLPSWPMQALLLPLHRTTVMCPQLVTMESHHWHGAPLQAFSCRRIGTAAWDAGKCKSKAARSAPCRKLKVNTQIGRISLFIFRIQ